MKKVLILSVTAGNGHNACARSVKNKLEEIEGDNIEVKIVDLLKTYSTKTKFWTADSGYNLAVSKLLPIYNVFFNHYLKISPYKRWKGGTQATARSAVGGLLKELLTFQPDVVFCTHFYAGIAMTDLKLVYDLPCKVVMTSLDYENSPFWESGIGVDYFSVPNEDFVEENIQEGYKKQQMLTLGIPVDERTLKGIKKEDARDKLGLEQNIFTAMVMFGGGFWKGGFKIFNDLVKSLKGRKAQIVMINGRNQKDFDRISKMTFPDGIKVVNVGFTKDVPLYMAASDIILNKGGGLCATEMINVGRPMLITEKLPMQEKLNLEYLKNKGVAMSFKNRKQLSSHVNKLFDDEDLRRQIEGSFDHMRRNGCEGLANLILSLENADYKEICEKEKHLIDNDFSFKNKNCKEVRKKVKKAMKKAHKESMKQRKLQKNSWENS